MIYTHLKANQCACALICCQTQELRVTNSGFCSLARNTGAPTTPGGGASDTRTTRRDRSRPKSAIFLWMLLCGWKIALGGLQ